MQVEGEEREVEVTFRSFVAIRRQRLAKIGGERFEILFVDFHRYLKKIQKNYFIEQN